MPRVTRSFSQPARLQPPPRRMLAKAPKPRRTSKETPLGEQLRRWRQRRKLSQVMAANRLHVSTRTLQNWEQGHRAPTGFALQQLQTKIRVK